MRVLELNTILGNGGTGTVALLTSESVLKNGGEVLYAYGRGKNTNINLNIDRYKICNSLEIIIHAFLSRASDRQGFYSRNTTKKLIQKIKQFNPDIIHLHNLHGYYIDLPILFNFLAEYAKPIVWTLHDCWAFTGHCSHFDFIGCEKWKTGCYDCPQKSNYPKSILLDQSKRNWEEKRRLFTSIQNMTIITPSYWLAGLVRESFFGKYPVQVIHNGIDLNVFKPMPSSWKEDYGITKPMILACAAQWGQRKGYADVLKIAEILPEYQVVIVGIDSKQAKNLPSNIVGIQRTDSVQELVKIYSAADVFINTTYEEVLGMVNIEAIACGTPVITYDTGGSPECIDEHCGVIVEKGNVYNLAERIPEAMRLSRESSITFSRNFSKTVKYSEYFRYFISLLQETGKR